MPTIVTKSIGNSGRDYTSLMAFFNAASAATSGNLITADQQWVAEVYPGEIISNSQQNYPPIITDATRNFIIHQAGFNVLTNAGALFYDASAGAAMRSNFGSGAGEASFIFNTAYTKVKGIQFKQTGSLNGAALRFTAVGCEANSNLITSSSGSSVSFESDIGVFRNNVIVQVSANNALSLGYASGTLIDFNTIYSATSITSDINGNPAYGIVGINNFQTFALCRNNSIFGYTSPFGAAISSSSSNNATDAPAFSVGSSNLTSLVFSDTFVSSTNLRIKEGAAIIGAGVTISGVTTDGLGQTRTSPPSIGAAMYAADVIAPTLTSPTGTQTGTTTASGTVVTDEANGTLYSLASTNATETAATVKSTGAAQAISTTGTKSVSATGLTSSTTYYFHYVHTDAVGNDSSRVSSSGFTTTASDTTAPVLTSPTGTSTGTTTGSGTVVTDEANGTLYSLATTNATETVATIKASGTTQTITTTGSKSVTFSGLAPSTTYYAHYVHRDSAGNDSSAFNSAGFTTTAAGDTTPPVISSPTGTQSGSTTATGTVITNEANGAMYRYVSTNATETAATIKAANTFSAVTATGTQSATFTGLTSNTLYYAHYVHRDAAGNDSNVVNSSSFTTAVASAGAFTSRPLVNDTDTTFVSQVGWSVRINNATTGALIATKTSLTTSSSGTLTYSDVGCTAGTNYEHIYIAPNGDKGMQDMVAT